jgi:hypothetical protein
VRRQIQQFDNDPRYYGAERAVGLVFSLWPVNRDLEQVLVIVFVLNQFYRTNIDDPYTVARHICERRIDARLRSGDVTLVEDLATVAFGAKSRVLYSFATKYCSWHQPEHFQIYDSYVGWLRGKYVQQFRFICCRRYELRQYPRFVEILGAFRAIATRRRPEEGAGQVSLDRRNDGVGTTCASATRMKL